MMEVIKNLLIPVISIAVAALVAYFTTTHTIRRGMVHGRARLLDICRRYILNFINAFDKKSRRVRTDPLAYELYVQELRMIIDDLVKLLDNVYVEKLILQYPRITIVIMLLRRELIQHSHQSKGVLKEMAPNVLDEVFKLNEVVSKELGRFTRKTDMEQEIRQTEKILREFEVI